MHGPCGLIFWTQRKKPHLTCCANEQTSAVAYLVLAIHGEIPWKKRWFNSALTILEHTQIEWPPPSCFHIYFSGCKWVVKWHSHVDLWIYQNLSWLSREALCLRLNISLSNEWNPNVCCFKSQIGRQAPRITMKNLHGGPNAWCISGLWISLASHLSQNFGDALLTLIELLPFSFIQEMMDKHHEESFNVQQ